MVLAAGGPLEYLRCERCCFRSDWSQLVLLPYGQSAQSFVYHLCVACRGPWNAFDFVMVLAGYTAFIPMGGGGGKAGAVRGLGGLGALGRLRTIARFGSRRSIIVWFLEVCCG